MKQWYCYLLRAEEGRTYVGMTCDLDRRLQQHNGERVGGASATRGACWTRVCHVEGFPDQTAALQFEWAWKNRTKKYGGKGTTPLERRLKALQELLSDSRPTAKSVPYSEYATPLEVVWDCDAIDMPTF